jgi:hypothetical protein
MKRYYKRLTRFPEGIDRLDAEVRRDADGRGVVTAEQIARRVDELFLDGGMKALVGYIILRHGAWEAAMKVGRDDSSKTSFRAVWALEWAYEQSAPDELPEWFFDRLVDDFIATTNGSLHRIYAKMICDRMRFCGARPTDTQAERLAERCFDLVITPATKVATRFWTLEILAELSPRLDWVARELPDTLRHISESPDCTPGLRVATREILKRL